MINDDEKECLPRATLFALKYIKMSDVTSSDMNERYRGNSLHSIHEGQPCLECTCCKKHLFYSSRAVAAT